MAIKVLELYYDRKIVFAKYFVPIYLLIIKISEIF